MRTKGKAVMTGGPADHRALLCSGTVELVDRLADFVRNQVEDGRPTLVALPWDHLGQVWARVGDIAGEVEWADIEQIGRNPGRLLPAMLGFAEDHTSRPPVLVGEPVWPGSPPEAYPATVQHEALINQAFAGLNAGIVCAYDVSALSSAQLDDVSRTHPVLQGRTGEWSSPAYGDPIRTANAALDGLEPASGAASFVAASADDLAAAREFIRAQVAASDVSRERLTDLVLSVHEALTNTLTHADGPGLLHCWIEESALIAQVTDRGRISDPLAGRRPPHADQETGLGLSLIHQLCDLVELRTNPAGTTIRMRVSLPDRASSTSAIPPASGGADE